MWRKSGQYFRTNWGAPFVLAFIGLLIVSAALLSAGQESTANDVAVYAFYALVLGVVLQIASYIKFGESEPKQTDTYVPSSSQPPRRWRLGKRTLAIFIVAIVIVASLATVIYYKPSNVSNTTSTYTTHATIGKLAIGVNFIVPTLGPNNSVQLTIGINETGGLSPFNFTAYWNDGVNQTNNVGVFIRSFSSNQSIPTSLKVVIHSSDGQTATISVQIPSVSRTTSTSTTTTSTTPTITFVESGLPSGDLWMITISGTEFRSNTSQLVFNYPAGNVFNYMVSGPYDTRNFAWAFIPSPESGSIETNKSDIRINIVFSNESVLTPSDSLFIMINTPTVSSTGAGSEQLSVTYLNAFPDQIEGIVFASLRNNVTGSLSVETGTISPLASGEQTISLVFNGISAGNYTASFFVESPNGVLLSQTTNTTFTKS